MRLRSILVFLVAAAALVIWMGDSITWEGERVVYTVSCQDGVWQQEHCTGRLAAAERVKFRALKSHHEVLFWTVGDDQAPSGKLINCQIASGRNWSCPPSTDAARSITLRMSSGQAAHEGSGLTRGFHAVTKPRWYLLRLGLPLGSNAEPGS
jgi:hypothetical protein